MAYLAVSPAALSKSELLGSSLPLRSPACLPPLPSPASLIIHASAKKINTKTPYGPGGGMKLKGGLDASGRKPKGKGVYQYANKYGANVDGYSPIYAPEEWSPSGDVYAGGVQGLLLWAVTLGAVLIGGGLLVFSTSALAQ